MSSHSIFISLCYLINVILHVHSNKIIDQISASGREILAKSRDGTTVRQCSCEEEATCITEIEHDIVKCANGCFDKAEQLTKHTEQLQACFRSRIYLAENFLDCITNNTKGCVADKNGPLIPKTDINELIRLACSKVHSRVQQFIETLNKPFDQMLSVADDIAVCIKACMVEKNKDGYCFDKMECQAKFEINRLRKTVLKCTKEINWKSEVAGLCECTVKAGIKELDRYCSLIRSLANKRGGSAH